MLNSCEEAPTLKKICPLIPRWENVCDESTWPSETEETTEEPTNEEPKNEEPKTEESRVINIFNASEILSSPASSSASTINAKLPVTLLMGIAYVVVSLLK